MLEVVRLGCIEFEANEDVFDTNLATMKDSCAPMAGIQAIGELQFIGKRWIKLH